MEGGRYPGRLFPHADDVYLLAPVPLVMLEQPGRGRRAWHAQLMADARHAFSEEVLDVPDVRHVNDLGKPPTFAEDHWMERQAPAVGVWHQVPTNQFLSLDTPAVRRLRGLVEAAYLKGLAAFGEPAGRAHISESWIQVYRNGDYKVLHNHERYGPPYPESRWVGAYYLDDGRPDPHMPYSGMLSFRIRNENHFVRPKAGLLLIWPADILHEVHPFYGSSDRVVVNFNINSSCN